MDEHYCLYAITWARCPPQDYGQGVDPRYPVELIRCGRLAALASRIGFDQFDLSKLQEGSADLSWVGAVAMRHHEIIAAVAQHWPVLPMRLGIFFQSRDSLIARLKPYEPDALEFLRSLADRQEWAAKLYVDQRLAERTVHLRPEAAEERPVHGGGGTQYLVAKKLRAQHRQQVEAGVGGAIVSIEGRLRDLAESWHRLRCLPNALTGRPENNVWNAAFLLTRSAATAFQVEAAQLSSKWASLGLMVEVTGPWPPYHFCPPLTIQQADSVCPCTS